MLKIDIFPHIRPPKYTEALHKKSRVKPLVDRSGQPELPAMYDVKARLDMMDRHEGYVQVLNIARPPLEEVASPENAAELAKIANDEMADLVLKYPDRFIAAVAHLPMNNMDAALKEVDRTIIELGFRGVQITTSIMDKPLHSPEFEPLFEKMNYYNLPILIHPRSMESGPRVFIDKRKDLPKNEEVESWAERPFDWPFETTLAMGHIVFSGLLEKYPNLKIITHHCGGFVPYQATRISFGLESAESRWGLTLSRYFTKKPIDYYKMMFGDTACWGNTAALMCGYAFFGADHILFGTDMPFDSQGGERSISEAIRSVEEMNISAEDRQKIFEGNAKTLFRLPI